MGGMATYAYQCTDGHPCGNPVRLVAGGAPILKGATMRERRLDFLARFDWIRHALMFEPRGPVVISGSFLCPPLRGDFDTAIHFLEASRWPPQRAPGDIGSD